MFNINRETDIIYVFIATICYIIGISFYISDYTKHFTGICIILSIIALCTFLNYYDFTRVFNKNRIIYTDPTLHSPDWYVSELELANNKNNHKGINLNILVWNVADLPIIANPIYGHFTNKLLIVKQLSRQHKCDMICLQEGFHKTRWEHFQRPNNDNTNWMNSGLASAIITGKSHPKCIFNKYTDSTGEDSLACKGFLHNSMIWKKYNIDIINTHLQADAIIDITKKSSLVRYRQMQTIFNYLINYIKNTLADIIIVCGDFNHDIYADNGQLHTLSIPSEWYLVPLHNNNIGIQDKNLDNGFAISRIPGCVLYRTILPYIQISDHAPMLLRLNISNEVVNK